MVGCLCFDRAVSAVQLSGENLLGLDMETIYLSLPAANVLLRPWRLAPPPLLGRSLGKQGALAGATSPPHLHISELLLVDCVAVREGVEGQESRKKE